MIVHGMPSHVPISQGMVILICVSYFQVVIFVPKLQPSDLALRFFDRSFFWLLAVRDYSAVKAKRRWGISPVRRQAQGNAHQDTTEPALTFGQDQYITAI